MSLIISEITDRIGYITINRPEKRNALNPGLIEALTDAFREAESDDDVKVIVIKANGDVFSAGADLAYLKQLQEFSLEENYADTAGLKKLYENIYRSNKVVIAQVEGHAIAGGCGLVSVCDIVFAVPEASFGYTEVRIGFIPALVACFLIRKLGETRTKELLLSGGLIDAATASAYGLINFVCAKADIAEKVRQYAEDLTRSTSGESIKRTKQLLRQVHDLKLEEALEAAMHANAAARVTDDCKKGIEAFLNKEKLRW
ncbi:MAG TPA: enoyl-CoA hydratase-related protein [Sphingobacteriaceae bacterium]